MLWHALNNAIATVPATLGWLPEDFEPEAWWALPACLVLAFSLWILWKAGRGNAKRGVDEMRPGDGTNARR
jgi:hypothetical protein